MLGRLTYLVMTTCSASMFFAANRVKRNTEQTVAIFFKDAVQSATVADQVWISSMYILGFDPGGENAFGWVVALANQDNLQILECGVCTGAGNAIHSAAKRISVPPVSIGIDAPLFWVMQGDRGADITVRKMVCSAGGSSGTVSHVNSLRGACLVQGILAAKIAHSIWPSIRITEAHPKALLAVSSNARSWLSELKLNAEVEHIRDAAVAAYSAFALIQNYSGWRNLVHNESNPFFPAGVEVDYYFPTERS